MILDWKYEEAKHSLSPMQAFEFAYSIFHRYKNLRETTSSLESVRLLLQNDDVFHFASDCCFPKLFLLATSDSTTEKHMNHVLSLAKLRERVNADQVSEMHAERQALEIAALAKSEPRVLVPTSLVSGVRRE